MPREPGPTRRLVAGGALYTLAARRNDTVVQPDRYQTQQNTPANQGISYSGTDFNLLARNRVAYAYKENGHDVDRGLYEQALPIHLVSNTTATVGLERTWKRLLFRAGPYIRPQLKRVSYQREAVYWGGQVQVLWRFSGR